jgi:hypothetical protein
VKNNILFVFKFKSKFLIYHLDHVGDFFVFVAANKPFSEVTLNSHVKLLFFV